MRTKHIKWLSVLRLRITCFQPAIKHFCIVMERKFNWRWWRWLSSWPNGYAIRTTGDNCIGYRFSVVDKSGNKKWYSN